MRWRGRWSGSLAVVLVVLSAHPVIAPLQFCTPSPPAIAYTCSELLPWRAAADIQPAIAVDLARLEIDGILHGERS